MKVETKKDKKYIVGLKVWQASEINMTQKFAQVYSG